MKYSGITLAEGHLCLLVLFISDMQNISHVLYLKCDCC